MQAEARWAEQINESARARFIYRELVLECHSREDLGDFLGNFGWIPLALTTRENFLSLRSGSSFDIESN